MTMNARTMEDIEDDIIAVQDEIAALEARLDQLDAERDRLLATPYEDRPFVFRESNYVPLDRPVPA